MCVGGGGGGGGGHVLILKESLCYMYFHHFGEASKDILYNNKGTKGQITFWKLTSAISLSEDIKICTLTTKLIISKINAHAKFEEDISINTQVIKQKQSIHGYTVELQWLEH